MHKQVNIRAIYSIVVILSLSFFYANSIAAQQGVITGKVINELSKEPIPYATVAIMNSSVGGTTDENGVYRIENLKPGYYNVVANYLGFEPKAKYEVQVFKSKPSLIDFMISESEIILDEVVVRPDLFQKDLFSPLSVKALSGTEIRHLPGGNGDLAKVVQTIPGIASSPASNRNDIIVRGGGPSENKFYVDDFEVKAVNHFATLGASGGFWGILDANQLDGLKIHTGAFPNYADGALSSVFDIRLKDGNPDKMDLQLNLGVLLRGINANGPIGKKTQFLAGVRQANFDIIFANQEVIPSFTDIIAKTVTKVNDNNKIEFLYLQAIDALNLNSDVVLTDESLYALERTPNVEQGISTIGMKWEHYKDNGIFKFILSRNNSTYDVIKFRDNQPSNLKLLDFKSSDTEWRIASQNKLHMGDHVFGFGGHLKRGDYDVNNQQFRPSAETIVPIDFHSILSINSLGLYANASSKFFHNKLSGSLGIRLDANDYSSEFNNPLNQIGYNTSLSWQIRNGLNLNANVSKYFSAPPASMLGYQEGSILVNKENGIKPIQCQHYTLGLDFLTKINSSIVLEGFYKRYNNYPVSIVDKISLGNKMAGFGVFGDESLTSTGNGRSYGFELMYHQKMYKRIYGMLTYTFVKSEFSNLDESYTSSSWDYGHILSQVLGIRLKSNWEFGMKWVYYGGVPYTPYDIDLSSKVENWDVNNEGVLDYSQLNRNRTDSYHQLDIRIDKKLYFSKFNLNFFADIQNVYNYIGGVAPILILDRTEEMEKQTIPNYSNSYKTKLVNPPNFGVRPNMGLMLEF